MLNFQLVNEINIAIREMPRRAAGVEYSPTAKRQLEALELLDGLLEGKSGSALWRSRFRSFCGIRRLAGACFSADNPGDELLLDDLLASCDEDVLDSLLTKYGEGSALGSRIKEYAQRYHVEDKTLKKQIQKDFSAANQSFYSMLREEILRKYPSPSKYYNEIRFSRKLFSKIKNADYVLSRENALWLIVGLAVILVFWNVFMAAACVVISMDSGAPQPRYEGSEIVFYVSRSEAIQRMRSKSVLFGRGDPYYTYPDYERLNVGQDSTQIHEVAHKERAGAYEAFVRWRRETLLPVLSYCFGKWIGILYSAIALFWLAAAAVGLANITGRGKRILYGSCVLFLGVQALWPMLDYYGIATWFLPVIFSTADWAAMFLLLCFLWRPCCFYLPEIKGINKVHRKSIHRPLSCPPFRVPSHAQKSPPRKGNGIKSRKTGLHVSVKSSFS